MNLTQLEEYSEQWPASEVCAACKVTVRYTNHGTYGLAWCECCSEGSEVCATINMPDGLSLEDCRELLAAARRVAALEVELRNVLASASPNERDHPCMFKAWARARAVLGGE